MRNYEGGVYMWNIKNKIKLSIVTLLCTLALLNVIFVGKANAQTTYQYFVSNIYESILCREPDSGGLQYWSSMLETGKITGSELVKLFVTSPEFISKNLSNSEYVRILYRAILLREPDNGGQAWWEGQLNIGCTRNYVLASFVNSPEFNNTCDQYGIKAGSIVLTDPVDIRTDLIYYLNEIYKTSLNRNPNTDEIRSYVTQLANKKITGANLAESILLCSEFENLNVSNDSYIKIIFNDFYNREPNSDELTSWIQKIQNNYTRKRILSDLLLSQEFKNLMLRYGIEPGTIKLTDPIDLRPDLVSFVTRLYNLTLNREPDSDGLSFYVSSLYYKRITGAQLIQNFLFSPEFTNTQVTANDYIKMLYRTMLNREADSGGLSWYLDQLMNGYSRLYVLSCFLNSSEFGNYVSAYNIDRGQIVLSLSDQPYNGIVNGFTYYLIDDGIPISIRPQPSTSVSKIDTITDKKKVVIVERTKGFYHVRYISSIDGILKDGYILCSFIDVINDNLQSNYSGVISEKYESSGNPGAISSGVGDAGGKSYGAWQLSSTAGSLHSFLQWLMDQKNDFYNILNNAYIADANTYGTNFDTAWRQIANDHYDEFYQLQHRYIKISYYNSLVNRLVGIGNFDKLLTSFAVRNVLWSTAVQHGVTGAYNLINRLVIDVNDKFKFINDIYAERSKVEIYFPSCSPDVQQSVINRFIKEQNDADRIYEYEHQYLDVN